MMNGGLSASDVAVLSGSNNRADEGYGFGGGWAWWIIILLIFGWGGAIADLVPNLLQGAFGTAAGTALFYALMRIPYVREHF